MMYFTVYFMSKSLLSTITVSLQAQSNLWAKRQWPKTVIPSRSVLAQILSQRLSREHKAIGDREVGGTEKVTVY